MEVMNQPNKFKTLQISFYSITVLFIIMNIILSSIDRNEFDFFIIINLVVAIIHIIILTISLKKEIKIKKECEMFAMNGLLWFINFIVPYTAYYNSNNNDFEDICFFLVITKGIANFIFMIFTFSSLAEY